MQFVRVPSCLVGVCSGILFRQPISLFVTFVGYISVVRLFVPELRPRLTSIVLFVRYVCSGGYMFCSGVLFRYPIGLFVALFDWNRWNLYVCSGRLF